MNNKKKKLLEILSIKSISIIEKKKQSYILKIIDKRN